MPILVGSPLRRKEMIVGDDRLISVVQHDLKRTIRWARESESGIGVVIPSPAGELVDHAGKKGETLLKWFDASDHAGCVAVEKAITCGSTRSIIPDFRNSDLQRAW